MLDPALRLLAWSWAKRREKGAHRHWLVGEEEWEVAEFSVVRAHRRYRVGRLVTMALFAGLPGDWTIFHDDTNLAAAKFWAEAVADASGAPSSRRRSQQAPASSASATGSGSGAATVAANYL